MKRVDKVNYEKSLTRVKKNITLLNTMLKSKGRWIEHITREILRNIFECRAGGREGEEGRDCTG